MSLYTKVRGNSSFGERCGRNSRDEGLTEGGTANSVNGVPLRVGPTC